VGVMAFHSPETCANPRIYPWEATENGCEFECESVGVMAFHSPETCANPRIYPWEATIKKNP
jgi:hypothetical protein